MVYTIDSGIVAAGSDNRRSLSFGFRVFASLEQVAVLHQERIHRVPRYQERLSLPAPVQGAGELFAALPPRRRRCGLGPARRRPRRRNSVIRVVGSDPGDDADTVERQPLDGGNRLGERRIIRGVDILERQTAEGFRLPC
jgi:hypothetical protein